MIKKCLLAAILLPVAVILSGCFTGGSFLSQNLTSVELSDAKYDIVARNVQGFATADYLIGLSYSTGNMANTLALARIGGTATLYDTAVRDIWKNYEEKHGTAEGKKLALINIRYDTDILNLLVYTKTDLYIHADVVEFKD
jgi:hypothetical protein